MSQRLPALISTNLTPFSGKQQLMLTTPITANFSFAPLIDAFRTVVREELASLLQAPAAVSANAVGGIELAMEVTRLSKSRVYALVQQRGIPHSKRGNKLYFNRADLLAWVEDGKRQEK
ncbi:DNA-binding protein [Hymenobacter sediminis]|uniref:helix-turn-helix domain-containing protein n=1 Tax=Hymenobacter sediminis TaxID=2218621 RepID=UPI000F4FC80A|nr:helix-turn-helix domain-containing protein [Hymenobacter sediminis]RPD49857.1 DNA-binding protein [Hymenobacter sediminis]